MEQDFRARRRSERAARPKRGDGLEPILRELDSLIGLDPVKDEIYRIVDFAKVVALKKERDLPVSNLTLPHGLHWSAWNWQNYSSTTYWKDSV